MRGNQPHSVSNYAGRHPSKFNCRNCGRVHESRNCPAFGTKCKSCGIKNHWASVCRSKGRSTNFQQDSRHINAVEQDSSESDSEFVYLGELQTVEAINGDKARNVWYQKITVNGNDVNFKLDTGAQVNVIPRSELLKWKQKPLVRKTKQPVLDYSDNLIPILGECSLTCQTSKVTKELKFVVTITLESSPILGLSSCETLGLIKRVYNVHKNPKLSRTEETPQQIIDEFSDVFSGTGRLNREVKIRLKENCTPNVASPRKIPLALQDRVKEELQRMVDMGVITKADEPTD